MHYDPIRTLRLFDEVKKLNYNEYLLVLEKDKFEELAHFFFLKTQTLENSRETNVWLISFVLETVVS